MVKILVLFEIAFGFFVFVRSADGLRKKNLISEQAMTKIVAISLSWMLVWALMPGVSVFSYSLLLWIPLTIFHFGPHLLILRRKRAFRAELLPLLNATILKMRVGVSFRRALQAASESLSDFSRVKVEQVLAELTLGSESRLAARDESVELLLLWFRAAETDTHRTLPRLIQLREKLQLESAFQKKITRALQQLYAQVAVLTALFSILVVFTVWRFGWAGQARLITGAVGLFAFGAWLSLQQKKRFRWTV